MNGGPGSQTEPLFPYLLNGTILPTEKIHLLHMKVTMRILIKWIVSKNELANYILGNARMQPKAIYYVQYLQDIIQLKILKITPLQFS